MKIQETEEYICHIYPKKIIIQNIQVTTYQYEIASNSVKKIKKIYEEYFPEEETQMANKNEKDIKNP